MEHYLWLQWWLQCIWIYKGDWKTKRMGGRSGCLFCSPSFTGIKTKPLSSYTFPSFSFTFSPHQPHSLSFPKLMSQPLTLNSAPLAEPDTDSSAAPPLFDYHSIDQKLLENIVYDALVWSTLNCLLVGDKSVQVKLRHPFFSLYYLDSIPSLLQILLLLLVSPYTKLTNLCVHFSQFNVFLC